MGRYYVMVKNKRNGMFCNPLIFVVKQNYFLDTVYNLSVAFIRRMCMIRWLTVIGHTL